MTLTYSVLKKREPSIAVSPLHRGLELLRVFFFFFNSIMVVGGVVVVVVGVWSVCLSLCVFMW